LWLGQDSKTDRSPGSPRKSRTELVYRVPTDMENGREPVIGQAGNRVNENTLVPCNETLHCTKHELKGDLTRLTET